MSEPAVLQESPVDYQTKTRQMGIASGISRRANAIKLRQLTDLLPSILPAVKQRLEQGEDNTHTAHAQTMARLVSHIERIDKALDVCDTPAGWRDLSQARFKLFEQWAHLAGIPKPMAAREVRTTRRVIQAPAAPIELPPVG